MDILDKPLHRFKSDEVRAVRQVADTLFVRLTQPFRQKRVDTIFDLKATMHDKMRTGHLLPVYRRVEKTHPKSSLVIAMSLSGIDRCFGVGLIPLLAQLKVYLNFKLYMYTDDLVEVIFADDGNIANDCDIAWNNVLGPCVLSRLASLDFDTQETKLLLIDSLGGGDSEWFSTCTQGTLNQARTSQLEYAGADNIWEIARQRLRPGVDPATLLPGWEKKVATNCEERWVDTPALREYLSHYIFNPRFGEKKHGQYLPGNNQHLGYNIKDFMPIVKEKFDSVHLLTPSFSDESRYVLDLMKRYRFVDYHHRADTLEGFGQTLVNIVYGRETDRITVPLIRFVRYVEVSSSASEEEASGHSENSKNRCFDRCEDVENWLPSLETIVPYRRRGTDEIEEDRTAWRDIALSPSWTRGMIEVLPFWRIDPLWSEYGKLREATQVLQFVRDYRIVASGNSLAIESRTAKLSFGDVKYDKTQVLQPYFEDGLSLIADVYELLPLRYVVWCHSPLFRAKKLALSACPSDPPNRRHAAVLHGQMHWLEHVCPPVGLYTNAMLQHLTGAFESRKLVPVGEEFCFPTKYAEWIVDYAGKWYRRHHTNLPNPTEWLAVNAEYFNGAKDLAILLEHDPLIVRAVAFALMGGPLALLKIFQAERLSDAEDEVERRQEKQHSRGGGYRSPGRPRKTTESETKNVEQRKSFGI